MNKFTQTKTAINTIKDAVKENTSYALFSSGITIIEGDEKHCISSVAWSLVCLKNQAPKLYSDIMKEIEDIEKYKKDIEGTCKKKDSK